MKDLLKLYSFESVHGSPDETAIADWICKWLDANGVEEYVRTGNTIYRLGNYEAPILSAHLDQVKTNGKAVKFFMNDAEKIIAFNDKWERTSLGADDKNGVWIILQALKTNRDSLNFIISEGEERGCIGIKKLETEGVLSKLILDTQFCLVLDRRGDKDVLSSGAGTTFCSTLAQDICNYTNDFKVASGSVSDTCTLCNYCESVNMSVAYEAPHTANEITDFKRLKEICEHVLDIIDDFVHYSTPPSVYTKQATTTYNYSKYYGGYYD